MLLCVSIKDTLKSEMAVAYLLNEYMRSSLVTIQEAAAINRKEKFYFY